MSTTTETAYPALYGETITSEHIALCESDGHAALNLQGADPDYCARCGEYIAEPEPEVTSERLSSNWREVKRNGEYVGMIEYYEGRWEVRSPRGGRYRTHSAAALALAMGY